MRFPWALLLVSALGCTLDERDLDAFQHTATGPSKLRAILLDSQHPPALRARAALDLLDLPRRDIDGRTVLFEDLGTLDASARGAIVPTFKEGLKARMRTPDGTEPSEDAVHAKDAGVKLLGMLSGKERTLLGTELVAWMAHDLEHRADVGKQHLESVARTVGAPAAQTLLAGLTDQAKARDVLRLAHIIDDHATPEVRDQAALRLIDVERGYRSPNFDARLASEAHDKGLLKGGVDDTFKAEVAARRRSALNVQILPALGLFADREATRAHLLALARRGDVQLEQRALSLDLLRGHVGPADLSPLFELALDARELPQLREAALTRAGELKATESIPSLLMLLTERTHAGLRQQAGEQVLELGGAETLPLFFRALPHHWDTQYGKREIDAYSERLVKIPADNAVLILLAERLHSSLWWHRVLALRYFAVRGAFDHVWRIRQHLADPNSVFGEGWPRGHTVGQEAQAALNVALERFRLSPSRADAQAQSATNL